MEKNKNAKFWAKGLRFSCHQCSGCCRFDPGFVFLSEGDLLKLIKWSNLKRGELIQVYCRWVLLSDGFEYLCLREKSNYDCVLWNNGCIAYEFRPIQCSTFPFWNSVLKDRDSWNLYGKDCPGIGNGNLYSYDEIKNLLISQEKEPYIKRKKNAE